METASLWALLALVLVGTLSLSALAFAPLLSRINGPFFTGVTSPSSPSSERACITNIFNPPQEQYAYLLTDLANNSDFISATQGRCFNFNSGYILTSVNSSTLFLVFDHLSGALAYGCGSLPIPQIDDRLKVSPVYSSNDTLTGFTITRDNGPFIMSCPSLPPS